MDIKLRTTAVIRSACGHVVALESISYPKMVDQITVAPWGLTYPNSNVGRCCISALIELKLLNSSFEKIPKNQKLRNRSYSEKFVERELYLINSTSTLKRCGSFIEF